MQESEASKSLSFSLRDATGWKVTGLDGRRLQQGLRAAVEISKRTDAIFLNDGRLNHAKVRKGEVRRTSWIFTEMGRFRLQFSVKGIRYDRHANLVVS